MLNKEGREGTIVAHHQENRRRKLKESGVVQVKVKILEKILKPKGRSRWKKRLMSTVEEGVAGNSTTTEEKESIQS